MQNFIRSVYIVRRATRSAPTSVLGNVYGSENEVKSAFTCHPERSVAQSKSELCEDRIVLCTIRDLRKAK